MRNRAVFLDRDGVLTVPDFRDGRSYAPTSLEAFNLYADATTSVARLQTEGFKVIVVTNQPDITTGKLSAGTLDEMNSQLTCLTGVDDIEVSIATRSAPDRRRKPATGMLIDAAARHNLALDESYMVGDRASDIACGLAVGCRAVFIDRDYTAEVLPTEQHATVKSLAMATSWIIQDGQGSTYAS